MDIVIWDSQPSLLFPEPGDRHFLVSREAFDSFCSFHEASRIFVLAELDWFGSKRVLAFHGFEVLKQLRLKRVRCPIIICSLLPRAYFLQQSNALFGFLRLPSSHPFLQLPHPDIFQAEFNPAPSRITLEQLEDAIYHFSNPVGTLDEILHNLKDKIGFAPREASQAAFDALRLIIPSSQMPQLDTIEAQFYTELEAAPKSLIKLVSRYKPPIRNLLPKSPTKEFEHQEVNAWGVLFIDDNAGQRQLVQGEFAKRGIQCFTANSGEEAFGILERDAHGTLITYGGKRLPQNFITVVVCDLRFEDEDRNWQPLQGYDIIQHIYQYLPNYLSFFVLTSKRKAILSGVARFRRMQVKWFAKEAVLQTGNDTGFNLFATQVKEDGESMLDTLCSFPKANTWHNSWKGKINAALSHYYRVFRLSSDYRTREQWISRCALEFIEEAELVRDKGIKHIKKVSNQSFSLTFKAGIKGPPSDQESMEKFYIKLIGRRIVVGLSLRGWDKGDISDILKDKELRAREADRQLFSAYLALSSKSEKEIPGNLLLEERRWVEEDLGYSLNAVDKNFFLALKGVLEEVSDALYKNDCPDEFADTTIIINNKQTAQQYLRTAAKLSRQYWAAYPLFEKEMKKLLQNEQFQNSIRRNGIQTLWEELREE